MTFHAPKIVAPRAVRRRRLDYTHVLAVAVVVVGLVLAAPAGAATSFALGPGGHPRIAMAGGAAHVVWLNAIPGPKLEIRYCRLPEGASECSAARSFAPDPQAGSSDWSQPFVLTGPGDRVVIVSGFCCSHVKAFVSTDGGTTFAAPKEIGTVVPRGPAGAAVGPAPDDISLLGSSVSSAGSVAYQRARLSGPSETAEVVLPSDVSVGYGWNVAMSGSIPVAAYSGPTNTQVTYYKGAGDLHSPSNWAAPFGPPAPDGDGSHLASGPSGVYLMHHPRGADGRWVVSRFTGSGFAAPAAIPGSSASNGEAYLFEDAGGRLHVIYNVLRPAGGDPPVLGLRYTSSDDGGASWTAPADVIRELGVTGFVVGASGPGQGLAAWATSPSDSATVKAARLAPLIPVAGSTPPPPAPVADTTAPTISAFSMTRRRFKVARKPATAFRYALSERASVVIAIERALPGRRVRRTAGRCVRPTRTLRRNRRCTRYRLVGTIRHSANAGPNTLPFDGRINRRRLPPGRYRAAIAATDAVGNRSQTRHLTFTVLTRAKRGPRQ